MAGSGAAIFRSMVADMEAPEGEEIVADIDGLRIANDMMAREIATGETWRSAFGAGYEVLYRGTVGFERVDDVLHIFSLVQVSDADVEILYYPHALRQWYEGDQLCMGSFVTPHAAQQGLEYRAFAIPSIYEEPKEPSRSLDTLAERPNYMCIHHLFDVAGKEIPTTLIMRGSAIDDFLIMSRPNFGLQFEPTQKYRDLLRKKAAEITRQLASA